VLSRCAPRIDGNLSHVFVPGTCSIKWDWCCHWSALEASSGFRLTNRRVPEATLGRDGVEPPLDTVQTCCQPSFRTPLTYRLAIVGRFPPITARPRRWPASSRSLAWLDGSPVDSGWLYLSRTCRTYIRSPPSQPTSLLLRMLRQFQNNGLTDILLAGRTDGARWEPRAGLATNATRCNASWTTHDEMEVAAAGDGRGDGVAAADLHNGTTIGTIGNEWKNGRLELDETMTPRADMYCVCVCVCVAANTANKISISEMCKSPGNSIRLTESQLGEHLWRVPTVHYVPCCYTLMHPTAYCISIWRFLIINLYSADN